MTETKVKFALSVLATDANQPMEDWPTYLADRSVADNLDNVDPSSLQILPYVTLWRSGVPANGEADGLYALRYTRGKAGAESRLHDLYSIGFGGHIESEVTTSLANVIVDETIRELQEELGYTANIKKMHVAVAKAIRDHRLLYIPDTAVGSVHLGLSVMLNFDEQHASGISLISEEGQTDGLEWVHLGDVVGDALESYEPWSRHLVQIYLNQLQQQARDVEEAVNALVAEHGPGATLNEAVSEQKEQVQA